MKNYTTSLAKLTLLYVLISTISCQGSCEDDVAYYSSQDCSIIVDHIKTTRPFTLKGRNVNTSKADIYRDQGGWNIDFKKLIKPGDTVIKLKDEMVFYIHKPDTTIVIPCECQGKIYQ